MKTQTEYHKPLSNRDLIEQGSLFFDQDPADKLIDKALATGVISEETANYHRACCQQEGGLIRFQAFLDDALMPEATEATPEQTVDDIVEAIRILDAIRKPSLKDLEHLVGRAIHADDYDKAWARYQDHTSI